MKRTALITGATSGIGLATAYLLSKNDFRLILCGRRQERLEQVRQDLQAHTDVHILNFDVRNNSRIVELIDSLPKEWKDVEVLINNAGNAHGLASIEEGEVEDWEAMIDINVKGLLYMTKAILPQMIGHGGGHIINIGSIAGKEVYPNGNVYCASKHAVDALNNGMRIDLNKYGIKVSSINPGLVETEFSLVRFKGDEAKAKSVYEGYNPLKPEDIADIILFALTRPYHVNISDLIVLPTAQASSTIVKKVN